jgi:hypothetical protein
LGKQDGISRYAQQWTEATISIYLGEPISAAFHNCKDVSPPSSLAISLISGAAKPWASNIPRSNTFKRR